MSDLAAALAALQADLPRIRRTTPGQHGKYAAYDKIQAAVRPIMAKHGFVWHTEPSLRMGQLEGRFALHYELRHLESGNAITGDYPLTEGPAQTMGAQISYAQRYCLKAVLDLEIEGDDNLDAPERRRPVRGAKVTGPDHERTREGLFTATPEQAPAERGPLPPGEDVWLDQPAGFMPTNDPEDKPGTITRDQSRAMHAQFNARKITDRDVRLGWVKDALGLDALASSNDLSYRQAARVLQLLHQEGKS